MKPKKGYVYIIQCEEFFKIGYTSNKVNQRLSNIRTSNPFPIKLICVFEWGVAGDALEVEGELHKLYKSKKQSGEWFKLKRSDIQNITNLHSENLKTLNPFKIKTIHLKRGEGVREIVREVDDKEVRMLRGQVKFLKERFDWLDKQLEVKDKQINQYLENLRLSNEIITLYQKRLQQ